jgi:Family of unknown function (DUF5681)
MPKGEHLKGVGGVLFKKGEPSRNPSGRPKGSLDSKTRLKSLFETVISGNDPLTGEKGDFTTIELMDLGMIAKAISGDVAAYNSLLDRYEGKAKQTSAISINAAHNLRYQINSPDDFKAAMLAIEEEERQLEAES